MGMHMNRWWWATVLMTSTAWGGVITVDDNAFADFATIHEAIDAAANGDEILVAPGTYNSTAPFGIAIINPLGKSITIRATGAASDTIIDGNQTYQGVYCENEETSDTIIEGFTITNGFSLLGGGGVECRLNSNPLIRDCIISGNSAVFYGGGVVCYSSSPTIIGCAISNNNTTSQLSKGGGIAILGDSTPLLNSVTISSNSSGQGGGGGMSCESTGTIVESSTITLNTTDGTGGGIHISSEGGVQLNTCVVSSNEASGGSGVDGYGGGIWTAGNTGLVSTTVCANTPDQIEDNNPDADPWDLGGNVLLDACGVEGACCIGETCSIMFEGDCQLLEGEFLGGNTNCNNDPCVEVPFGACCLGTCAELTRDQCLASDGTFLGDGISCDGFPCSEVQPVLRWHHLGDNLVSVESTDTWTVDVYVELPEAWRLDAVAGNSQQILSVSTTGTFYQNVTGGSLSNQVNEAFYPLLPELEWDSRFGIGCMSQQCDGADTDQTNSIGIDFTDFEAGLGFSSENGSWFVLPSDPQGDSGLFTDSSTGQTRNGVRIGRLTLLGLDSTVTIEALLNGRESDGVSSWQQPVTGVISRETDTPPCSGDLNTDSLVGLDDLTIMIEHWGNMGGIGDLDGEDGVGIPDLLLLLSHWGPCAP